MDDIQEYFNRFIALLPQAMHADRVDIRRRLRQIKRMNKKKSSNKDIQKALNTIEVLIKKSIQKKRSRQKHLPFISFESSLPITQRKDDIIQAIEDNPVIIISGETGSGKTTQIPKFCMSAGRGIDGLIGSTQPRRIAATTVAHRIAEELGETVGKSVGYKIRFSDKTGKNAYIKIMTDGILLAETQTDPYLNAYDTIIVDEAHERSLNIDFVLGVLKTLLKKRDDLKLIITSATIDTEKFSMAFNDAPVIEVSGRMFPVETRYLEPPMDASENNDLTYVDQAVRAVEKLHLEHPQNDVLVFMPTEQDIRETCDLLSGRRLKDSRIFPLYARLSAAEQKRVFAHIRERKIIVATNVAETSITIPGIKYVVDTGLARISQYTPKSRITSLPILPISKSSADQRKGRCGRIENGVCIRLYSEDDYISRPRFTKPEILRSNLAEVILRMLFLNLGTLDVFPFIDRPREKSIHDGFNLLQELGAIKRTKKYPTGRQKKPPADGDDHDDAGVSLAAFKLTQIGKIMAKIPIDPRLSRMIIEADKRGCLEEITIIASALSIQDPRERPIDMEAAADEAHRRFIDPQSDFMTLLNIWREYILIFSTKKRAQKLKTFCKSNFLSFKRMREWRDIYNQITAILQENGFRKSRYPASTSLPESQVFSAQYVAVHQSILSGFLSNIAQKKEKQFFKAAKDRDVMIFPGSGLFENPGAWIVSAELVETSRLFARIVANIDHNWLESIGKDQCRTTYSNPRWSRKRGEVMADEQVSLFGLIIVPKRSVSYGRVNPQEAMDIFIQNALVEGDSDTAFPFMTHNLKLLQEIIHMENRIRRRDVLVSNEDIFRFYKNRLPHVHNIRTLKKMIRKRGNDDFLKLKRAHLLRYDPDPEELARYPDQIALGNQLFECRYAFEPGKADDGVTITIPALSAQSLESDQLDWAIPGLFEEKIEAFIKGLPKTYRKKLMPLSSTIEIILREMPRHKGALATSLSHFLYHRSGIDIPASAWDMSSLPDYLKARIEIIDTKKRVILAGRDLSFLQQKLSAETMPDTIASKKMSWEKTGLTDWNFGDIPDAVKLKGTDETEWILYPGLKKTKTDLRLSLFSEKQKAKEAHKEGVALLFTRYFKKELKYLRKNLCLPKASEKEAEYFGGIPEIEKQLYGCVTKELFQKDIRRQKDFFKQKETLEKMAVHLKGQHRLKAVIKVLETFYNTRATLHRLEIVNPHKEILLQFLSCLKEDLRRLVPRNFIVLYDIDQMMHINRYVKAIEIRVQRGVVNLEKDRQKDAKVSVFISHLQNCIQSLSQTSSPEKRRAVEEFFWLIEEFKVSLFAQELKTAIPISQKKLKDKVKQIERMV